MQEVKWKNRFNKVNIIKKAGLHLINHRLATCITLFCILVLYAFYYAYRMPEVVICSQDIVITSKMRLMYIFMIITVGLYFISMIYLILFSIAMFKEKKRLYIIKDEISTLKMKKDKLLKDVNKDDE